MLICWRFTNTGFTFERVSVESWCVRAVEPPVEVGERGSGHSDSFLWEENRILRSRVDQQRLILTPEERSRLLAIRARLQHQAKAW